MQVEEVCTALQMRYDDKENYRMLILSSHQEVRVLRGIDQLMSLREGRITRSCAQDWEKQECSEKGSSIAILLAWHRASFGPRNKIRDEKNWAIAKTRFLINTSRAQIQN